MRSHGNRAVGTPRCDHRGVPRRVSSAEFVGRGPELAGLLEALERAADGHSSAVFVAGDSGIGKSRLLGELERAASDRGARVLTGECVALAEGELPYAPLRSALRGLAGTLESDDLDRMLGSGRDELARLVPELGGPEARRPAEPGAPESGAQARLFELVLSLLVRLSDGEPVVVAMEDIHWADSSTLDFLAFLVANTRHERLLLVCTYRSDELHRRHTLRPFLARHERPPAVERIDLSPFTLQELDAQLQGILGGLSDPDLVARLFERTGGNPFFAEELLAASEDASELPASVRDALLLRVEVLPERAQEVLRMAAAHGRLVSHRLLAAASELTGDELDAALREALTHQIVVPRDEGTYGFRHALLQETLESDLLPGERAGLHLALARAIEADPRLVSDDGRAAAELHRHWLGAHRLPEAFAAAVRAAREAEDVYAFPEATDHLKRALELWSSVEDAAERAGMQEAELYGLAGEMAHLSGRGSDAIRLAEVAIAKTDPATDVHRAALLREQLGRYLWLNSGDTEGALHAYQEAVDLLPADEPRRELARALAGLGQILMLTGHPIESIERSQRAIAVARQVGARAEEAEALNTLGGNFGHVGERRRGIEAIREALRISEELGTLENLARAYINLGELLDQDAQIEAALELALEGARRTAEVGLPEWGVLLCEGEAAGRALKLGRLAEADRLTETALELPPSLAKLSQCAGRARLEIHRGRIAEAERFLAAAADALPQAPGPTWSEPLASARVEFELLRRDSRAARRLGEEALTAAAAAEYVAFTARVHALTARACANLAEAARAARDPTAANEAVEGAGAIVDRIDRLVDPDAWSGSPPPEAVAYRKLCAAEASRAAGTADAGEWAAVVERWKELGLPLEQAYARLHEAECLLAEGDRDGASDALAAGLQIVSDAGADWLRDELRALARRGRLAMPSEDLGAAPPVDEALERLGLTDRELEVLELLATGMTNREIGERLFMSQKTASVHVSRILTKLEVSSRVEAATAAQRLGLVP
jgi:DNA-binding CsgD family transcriptional regulator/tetratricopeptide (TPR) repeat protein